MMYHCPICSGEVVPDSKDDDFLLCHVCKKRFDKDRLIKRELKLEAVDAEEKLLEEFYEYEGGKELFFKLKKMSPKVNLVFALSMSVLSVILMGSLATVVLSIIFGFLGVDASIRGFKMQEYGFIKSKIPYVITLVISVVGIASSIIFFAISSDLIDIPKIKYYLTSI